MARAGMGREKQSMTLDTGAGSVSVKLSLARLVPRLWATWLPGGIVGLVLAVAGILPPPVTVVMSVGIGFIAVWSAFIFSLGFGLELCETGLKRHLPSFHPAFIFMGARLIDEVAWSEVESITSMWLLPLAKFVCHRSG